MKQTQFNCPVEATLSLIGGKYKPLILWHLETGLCTTWSYNGVSPAQRPKCSPSSSTIWRNAG